jgi:hypothetical protein
MAVKPIPAGFHSVTPYLFVNGVDRLLDFVKAAFDAKEEVCLHRRGEVAAAALSRACSGGFRGEMYASSLRARSL